MNRVQFQSGLLLPEFNQLYGTEAQSEASLPQVRWPPDSVAPLVATAVVVCCPAVRRMTFQCNPCHRQISLIAGTLFQASNLPLTTWFLAIYLMTSLSALALKRHLGVSYPTAWLIHHNLMQTMAERDEGYRLSGAVQMDDAYLGGERPDGMAGRGSENKVPFVVAVSTGEVGRIKLPPVPGFTTEAVPGWAKNHLSPGSTVLWDGLACFSGVSAAGCWHSPAIVGGRKPDELPEFCWVNTVLGNVKASLSCAYHAFDFNKYARRYLSAIAYRFNRRFQIKTLPVRLLIAAATNGSRPETWLSVAENSC